MSNQPDSSSKGWTIIITSVIGVIGTIAVAYFAFRGAIYPKQLEIEATQRAQSIQFTQMANNIWITQTAQSIEVTRFAESIKATQTSAALNSNSTTSQSVQATQTPLPTAVPPTAYIAPPPTAAPIVVSNTYEYIRDNGNQVGVQKTEFLDYIVDVRTVDLLRIEVSIPPTDNEVIFHILLDDIEVYTTPRLGLVRFTSGLIDLSPHISQGTYKLTISPEGILGGSNVGTLWIYGATLHVETNMYP